MKTFTKPPLFISILAILFVQLGIVVKSPGSDLSPELVLIGIVMGIVYWIWTVVEINWATHLRSSKKKIWLAVTIMLPLVGALVYQFVHERSSMAA